ncbi:MAG: ATP synthase F1 subunit epsilon [Alphaproteobacteria bacterium RIFCSPHIGHO2_12_FULL_63_12]|nr:MAG: ATP synthase F1 subunit epsilon [Alphaproteobacteria bacterium RIFCSPHIGHO2_12_FULL_63_12]
MADKLHFNLVSPEKELFSGDVDMVEAPGVEGAFGVLPNHAPFMTVLLPGVVKVKTGGDEKRIFVRGGFAEVTPLGLTILAEEAIPVADLSRDMIAERIKNAEQDLADADATLETKLAAETTLTRMKELQAAL